MKSPEGYDIDKKRILDYIYYEVGNQRVNFRVCSTYEKNGEVYFSKWKTYLEAQENPYWFNKINQREQLDCEIIIDVDEGDYDSIINQLEKDGIYFVAYKTKEDRARHIHTYWNNLIQLPKRFKEEVKYTLLKKYSGDLHFKSDTHMIPLELYEHWRTGLKKEVYRYNGNFNELCRKNN